MPGLVVFGRRWQIASDDFVFPGCFELFFRVLWWIGIMILFIYHKFKLDCNGRGVLYIYLVGLLVVLGLIILSLCVIVYVSAQGKLSTSKNFPGIRRFFPTLVYLRALLYIPELVWACLGAYWVSDDSQGCEPATVDAVIAAVVARWYFYKMLLSRNNTNFAGIYTMIKFYIDNYAFHVVVFVGV
uniref:Uncharacterized protein n=1 Tax=Mola mola TaxID=94237 RepID=A0A3Q4APG5_MOLML